MMNEFQQATLLDVRTPGEFAGGHIDNAINIPLDELPARIREVKEMKKPIVAYCRSGQRSGTAVSFLKQNGVAEVVNGGGIDDVKMMIR